MVCRITVIATGARVHRGNKHKRARIFNGVLRTADGNLAVFEGLTEHFKGSLIEFRQFIEKEHPMVGHTYFTWQGFVATTGHRYLRYRMVWATERTLRDE